ncbi:MAG: efflux RND transporter periplasmic adaptor subunit [candidate division WOR-3 bacterium]
MNRHINSPVITITFLVMLVLLGTGCNRTRESMASVAPGVSVFTVEPRTVARSIQLLGILQGEQQVIVSSKITGRVTEIVRPEGSPVQTDEPIAYVLNDIPGMDYKPGPVRSPITGVVGKIYVEPGQMVTPAMPFAAIARYSERIKMKAFVSDADLPYVRRNARAEVSFSAIPETTFTGTVTQVSPIIDPQSRSATVEITIPNPKSRLIPGMAGMARLTVEQKDNCLAIPLNALFTTDESRVVVVENGIARFRNITIGIRGDEWVEVTSGLNPGDQVVTTGKERVSDGQQVTVVESEAK